MPGYSLCNTATLATVAAAISREYENVFTEDTYEANLSHVADLLLTSLDDVVGIEALNQALKMAFNKISRDEPELLASVQSFIEALNNNSPRVDLPDISWKALHPLLTVELTPIEHPEKQLSELIFIGRLIKGSYNEMCQRLYGALPLFRSVEPFSTNRLFLEDIATLSAARGLDFKDINNIVRYNNLLDKVRTYFTQLQASMSYIPYDDDYEPKKDRVQARTSIDDYIVAFYPHNELMKQKNIEIKAKCNIASFQAINGDGDCYFRAMIRGRFEEAIIAEPPEREKIFEYFASLIETELFKEGSAFNKDKKHKEPFKVLIAKLRAVARGEQWCSLQAFWHDMLAWRQGSDDYLLIEAFRYVIAEYVLENKATVYNGLSLEGAIAASDGYTTLENYRTAHITKMRKDAEDSIVNLDFLPTILRYRITSVLVKRDDVRQPVYYREQVSDLSSDFKMRHRWEECPWSPRMNYILLNPGHYSRYVTQEEQDASVASQERATLQDFDFTGEHYQTLIEDDKSKDAAYSFYMWTQKHEDFEPSGPRMFQALKRDPDVVLRYIENHSEEEVFAPEDYEETLAVFADTLRKCKDADNYPEIYGKFLSVIPVATDKAGDTSLFDKFESSFRELGLLPEERDRLTESSSFSDGSMSNSVEAYHAAFNTLDQKTAEFWDTAEKHPGTIHNSPKLKSAYGFMMAFYDELEALARKAEQDGELGCIAKTRVSKASFQELVTVGEYLIPSEGSLSSEGDELGAKRDALSALLAQHAKSDDNSLEHDDIERIYQGYVELRRAYCDRVDTDQVRELDHSIKTFFECHNEREKVFCVTHMAAIEKLSNLASRLLNQDNHPDVSDNDKLGTINEISSNISEVVSSISEDDKEFLETHLLGIIHPDKFSTLLVKEKLLEIRKGILPPREQETSSKGKIHNKRANGFKKTESNYAWMIDVLATLTARRVLTAFIVVGLAASMIALGVVTGPEGWVTVAKVVASALHMTPAALGITGGVTVAAAGFFRAACSWSIEEKNKNAPRGPRSGGGA